MGGTRSRRTRPGKPYELNIHLPNHEFTVGINEMHRAARRAHALAFGQALQTVYAAAGKKAADLGDSED